mgnify:CR=1 FL=1
MAFDGGWVGGFDGAWESGGEGAPPEEEDPKSQQMLIAAKSEMVDVKMILPMIG